MDPSDGKVKPNSSEYETLAWYLIEHEEALDETDQHKTHGGEYSIREICLIIEILYSLGKRNRKHRRAPKEEDSTRSSESSDRDRRPRTGHCHKLT